MATHKGSLRGVQLRYALLCDYSSETNDGKLNILGTTDAVYAMAFPAIHKHAHVIVSFQIEPEDFGTRPLIGLQLIDEDGRNLLSIEAALEAGHMTRIINHRHILHDIALPKPGTYQFTITVDGRAVWVIPFQAIEVKGHSA